MPQFLSGRFGDAEGVLHVWDFTRAKYRPSDTIGVFAENHLYRFHEDEGTNTVLEEDYAQLEGRAASIVKIFVDNISKGELPKLTEGERGGWEQFYYQQMKRVPSVLKEHTNKRSIEDRIKDVIPRIEGLAGRSLSNEEQSYLLSAEYLRKARSNVFIKALRDPGEEVIAMFKSMAIQFGVLDGEDVFLLGSRPIVLDALDDSGTRIENNYLQWWLPISPKIAVRFAGEIHGGDTIVSLKSETVLEINKLIIRQSDIVLTNSKEALERILLTRDGELATEPDA